MFRLMSLSQWDAPIGLLNLLLTKASLETFASSQLDCWRKPLFCGSASTQQTLFREESVLLVEEVLFKDCVLISLESSIFSTLCRSFLALYVLKLRDVIQIPEELKNMIVQVLFAKFHIMLPKQ